MNPFRFSTKFQDDESDLLYYGYRYYDASTGRWLSRDPIEEAGGANTYAMVDNEVVNKFDFLGFVGQEANVDLTIQLGLVEYHRVGGPNGYTMGLLGLLGLQEDLHFDADDAATREMRRSRTVEIDRERARKALRIHCSSIRSAGPVEIGLGNELAEIQVGAYPLLFAIDMVANNTAAFIGSWTGGLMTARNIDCCRRIADLHFSARNVSGLPSASHLPPILGRYGISLFGSNPFGANGPMHNFAQNFEWDEKLKF